MRKRKNTAQNVSQELDSENVLVASVVNNLDTWRESVEIQCQRTTPGTSESFFMPGDAFAQLHNLVSHIAFTGVSETLDGSPNGFDNEADWAASNDEPELQDDTSEPKHHDFVGLILEPARGLTDTGAQLNGGANDFASDTVWCPWM